MKKVIAISLAAVLTVIPVAKPAYAVLTGETSATEVISEISGTLGIGDEQQTSEQATEPTTEEGIEGQTPDNQQTENQSDNGTSQDQDSENQDIESDEQSNGEINEDQDNELDKKQVNPAFEGLPYGLAKRQTLPPGLAKKEVLPPGLQKKLIKKEVPSTTTGNEGTDQNEEITEDPNNSEVEGSSAV